MSDVSHRPRMSGQARNDRIEQIADRKLDVVMKEIGDRALPSISYEGLVLSQGGVSSFPRIS